MSKIHYFQRYSSIENTVTNNTLLLIGRIYDYSASRASKLLSSALDETIEIGIEINQQSKGQKSIPDGAIIQRSFKILIESKVDSTVNEKQLIQHAESFSGESQQILLLLTRQKLEPNLKVQITKNIREKFPAVLFKNITYEDICNSLEGLFQEYEYDIKSLADDYIEYCNDANLFDQSKYLMRIVPCGASLALNRKYGIYFHSTDRGYTKHSFVGIYANKTVQCLWHIDSIFDVSLIENNFKKELVDGKNTDEFDENIKNIIKDAETVCGYNIKTKHRFFCGKNVIETNYKKISFSGIQGARFVNLFNVIGDFKDSKEVGEKLNGLEWR